MVRLSMNPFLYLRQKTILIQRICRLEKNLDVLARALERTVRIASKNLGVDVQTLEQNKVYLICLDCSEKEFRQAGEVILSGFKSLPWTPPKVYIVRKASIARLREKEEMVYRFVVDRNYAEFLRKLAVMEGERNMRDCAGLAGFSYSHAIEVLAEFERDGLVNRKKDGRDFLISMTDAGRKFVKLLDEAIKAVPVREESR